MEDDLIARGNALHNLKRAAKIVTDRNGAQHGLAVLHDANGWPVRAKQKRVGWNQQGRLLPRLLLRILEVRDDIRSRAKLLASIVDIYFHVQCA